MAPRPNRPQGKANNAAGTSGNSSNEVKEKSSVDPMTLPNTSVDTTTLLQIIANQQQQQAEQQKLLNEVLQRLAVGHTGNGGSATTPTQTGHEQSTFSSPAPVVRAITLPKLSSPDNLSIPQFRDWKQRWEDYTNASQLNIHPITTQQGVLRSALDSEWTILWTSGRLQIEERTNLKDIIKIMEAYLRTRRNPLLDRQSFHHRDQMDGESVDRYYSALRILDDACDHHDDLKCSDCDSDLQSACYNGDCGITEISLAKKLQDIRIRDRLICGLRDDEMQRRVLTEQHTTPLTLERVLAICTAMENSISAGASLGGKGPALNSEVNVAAKRSSYKKQQSSSHATKYQTIEQGNSNERTCRRCGDLWHEKVEDCRAISQTCGFCGKEGHFQRVCMQKKKSEQGENSRSPRQQSKQELVGQAICHIQPSEFLKVPTTVGDTKLYLNMLADTGAGVDGIGYAHYKKLGPVVRRAFTENGLDAAAANGVSLHPMGSFPATFSINNRVHNTTIQVYRDLKTPLLGRASCVALGLIPMDWPHSVIPQDINAISSGRREFQTPSNAENDMDGTKSKILEEHKDAFNDEQFRAMEGPAMKISLIDGAIPCKRYKAHTVPYHWREQVQEQLQAMVKKGVIEAVPVGEPIDWCHPMVVVAKKGSAEPRLTVDFTGLNKFVRRPAYPVRVPREVIARIPPGMKYFTTLDARHGYWQVPLDNESKKLTTFITPWGCFRYLRNAMGLISAGDEHNRRGDEAIQGIQNVEKIVEDVLIYDVDLKTHIKRVKEVIDRCNQHGITLNAKKFHFAQESVEWCGYVISPNGYTPAPHLVSALKGFPVPTSKTDVRSFCGLVQQFESFSNRITELMSPIRSLLSNKSEFIWIAPHQQAFQDVISELTSPRVLTHFNPARPVRLETDAAQSKGLGFALWQEEENGTWKLLQTGSRFVTSTESRYSASEVEMLAVVWAIKKCRLFLLGKPFEIIVDHRPLIPIINSKTLDEIDNPRLQRFKEKISSFRPFAIWREGKKHTIVDTFSRYPTSDPNDEDLAHQLDADPTPYLLAALQDPEDGSRIITDLQLKAVYDMAKGDSEYQRLLKLTLDGFPYKPKLDSDLSPYWKFRESLSVEKGLIYYGSRLVIPTSLRASVLQTLHMGHQGQAKTLLRAQQAVFWPGICNDVRNVVRTCRECSSHLPSQQKEPMLQDPLPSYPFQEVGADLFEYAGYEYLVLVDRFSGWSSVDKCGRSATSSRIIEALKDRFTFVGIPEKLISDNGPQFSSFEFRNWTNKWGITHSTSSPHYPQSNGLAESAVKAIKTLLSKTSPNGALENEEFQLGLLEMRNTPRADGRSPAQLLYGAPVRTLLPLNRNKFIEQWKTRASVCDERATSLREKARARYDAGSRPLHVLKKGDIVLIQDVKTQRWSIPAEIIEGHVRGRSYTVRTESGKVYRRNRRYLRPFHQSEEPKNDVDQQIQAPPGVRRSNRTRRPNRKYLQTVSGCNPGSHLEGGHGRGSRNPNLRSAVARNKNALQAMNRKGTDERD